MCYMGSGDSFSKRCFSGIVGRMRKAFLAGTFLVLLLDSHDTALPTNILKSIHFFSHLQLSR